jgi:hypothetical protein
LPDTVAVPTVWPPVVQSLGAEVTGPNTLNVIVPVAPSPPDSVAVIAVAGIATFVVPLAGADTGTVVPFTSVVEGIPDPQALFDAALEASPL